MKRKMRLLSFALIIVLLATMLGGCVSDFDARRYVQGTLDCYIKGEFDDFMFMTDSTEEESQIEYDGYFSFVESSYDGYEVTDEVMDELIGAYKELYQAAEYSAKDGVKNEDGSYSVDVEIKPLTVVTLYNETIYDDRYYEAEDKFFTDAEEAGIEVMEADYDQMVAEFELSLLEEMIDNITYGDPVTITVLVYEDYDGLYVISEDDFWALDESIFNY